MRHELLLLVRWISLISLVLKQRASDTIACINLNWHLALSWVNVLLHWLSLVHCLVLCMLTLPCGCCVLSCGRMRWVMCYMCVPQRSWSLGVQSACGSPPPQRLLTHKRAPHCTHGLWTWWLQPGPAQTHPVRTTEGSPAHAFINWFTCSLNILLTDLFITLTLPRPAPLSEHVRTVLLPVAGCEVSEDFQCLMYGWGETKGTSLFILSVSSVNGRFVLKSW